MIGVLGQYCSTARRLMAIGIVASGPAPTLGHQRDLGDTLSSNGRLDVICIELHYWQVQ
jgi:hypothetical protein